MQQPLFNSQSDFFRRSPVFPPGPDFRQPALDEDVLSDDEEETLSEAVLPEVTLSSEPELASVLSELVSSEASELRSVRKF
jgi:hypothetical protein